METTENAPKVYTLFPKRKGCFPPVAPDQTDNFFPDGRSRRCSGSPTGFGPLEHIAQGCRDRAADPAREHPKGLKEGGIPQYIIPGIAPISFGLGQKRSAEIPKPKIRTSLDRINSANTILGGGRGHPGLRLRMRHTKEARFQRKEPFWFLLEVNQNPVLSIWEGVQHQNRRDIAVVQDTGRSPINLKGKSAPEPIPNYTFHDTMTKQTENFPNIRMKPRSQTMPRRLLERVTGTYLGPKILVAENRKLKRVILGSSPGPLSWALSSVMVSLQKTNKGPRKGVGGGMFLLRGDPRASATIIDGMSLVRN
ncbi:hypothetical protein GWK47_053378 [Chionoecetes opilio]|uniref:Uncharacterized protein n=1 Tax=Chionoecetes opilio TaxID=41210 RepID=A0A8J5CQU9_CHIOP|nr:hypothetical protein GWK47_053378 [Chionoecetes opilio]